MDVVKHLCRHPSTGSGTCVYVCALSMIGIAKHVEAHLTLNGRHVALPQIGFAS